MSKQKSKDAVKALMDVYSADYKADGILREIETDRLIPFSHLPFRMYSEEQMTNMIESIRQNGMITPVIVRPRSSGRSYEIISGHQRVDACMHLGLPMVPCVIREMNDQDAVICMVDSNLQQRGELKHSEKAFAYKLKQEAIEKKRASGAPMEHRKTRDMIAIEGGDSSAQVQRLLRLNYLTPELQGKADNGTLTLRAAVELSYLSAEEQEALWSVMLEEQTVPTWDQAKVLRGLAKAGRVNARNIRAVLNEESVDTDTPVKPEQTKPSYHPVTPCVSDVADETVLSDPEPNGDGEDAEPEPEPPAAPESVIRLPRAVVAPFFPAEMSDRDVERVILALLQRYGSAVKELVTAS